MRIALLGPGKGGLDKQVVFRKGSTVFAMPADWTKLQSQHFVLTKCLVTLWDVTETYFKGKLCVIKTKTFVLGVIKEYTSKANLQ